jgi:hypothetical protein
VTTTTSRSAIWSSAATGPSCRDVNYKLPGYADKRVTFDQNGIKVFNGPAPELLLKCKHPRNRFTATPTQHPHEDYDKW